MDKNALRGLPSIDELLRASELNMAVSTSSAALVAECARAVLDEIRSAIISGKRGGPGRDEIIAMTIERLSFLLKPSVRRVINASGTILHTNIGRAGLSDEAADAIALAASGNMNLEIDLATGERGERDSLVEGLIKRLTGAEAAAVVNNNAAAVLLALNTLSEGMEVVISRGELVEIGGSFRLPEIIRKSGFTSDVGLKELSSIGKRHGVPLIEDLGSGSLVDLSIYGLPKEPTVRESIEEGADLVTFSGGVGRAHVWTPVPGPTR